MKYNKKSAEVLSDADRMERILDWQLFTIEQEQMLWGAPEREWRPGRPMYPHPFFLPERDEYEICPELYYSEDPYFVHFDCDICERNRQRNDGHTGNCVRPMFQEFDETIDHWVMQCQDCEVGWKWDVKLEYMECWMCGDVHKNPRFYSFKDYGVSLDVLFPGHQHMEPIGTVVSSEMQEDGLHVTMRLEADISDWQNRMVRTITEGFGHISLQMPRMVGRFHEMSRQMALYAAADAELTLRMYEQAPRVQWADEIQDWEWSVESYHPPTQSCAFEQPDIRGPLWGTAAFYDRLNPPEPVYMRPSQRRRWDMQCEGVFVNYMNNLYDQDPPLPVMQEIPLPEPMSAYWTRFTTNDISRRFNVRR